MNALHRPLGWLVAAALLASAPIGASAESVLQQHRRAVQQRDTEQVTLKGTIAAKPNDDTIKLTITSASISRARIYSLDLVQMAVGETVIPVRILRASIAQEFLESDTQAGQDDEAVAALIIDDVARDAPTALVAYKGPIAQAIRGPIGTKVELRVTRYRQP